MPDLPSGTTVIYKYRLDPWVTGLNLPRAARLLHVHAQGDEAYVWAEVDPTAPIVERCVESLPTGSTPLGAYVGTFHLATSGLVFHVYDRGEVPTR